MPAKIDQNLIPPVIREAVDPEILARAQSIEWSINRDVGEDERGYLDGSHEDYLTSQNLMHKSHKLHQLEASLSGRDSGLDYSPASPNLRHQQIGQGVDLSPLDESLEFAATGKTNATGSMKRHPQGLSPYPMYRVNQEQLQGDVVFEAAPRAKPGERTVHYEKSSRVLNEQELNALGLDPKVFGPNTRTTMDEQEEETIETSLFKGGRKELEDLYQSMRIDKDGYFDRQRARSVSPVGNRNALEMSQKESKKTVIFGSMDEIDNREQEFYPYRDAHQGKPLPGDNEYGTWGSRFDEQKQWKLCNGQWVRVAEPKPKPAEPKYEKYMAEKVKCKPPKKIQVARAEPVRKLKPQSGSTDNSDLDSDSEPINLEPLDLDNRNSLPRRRRDLEPLERSFRKRPLLEEPPVDIDALKDKYRPKEADLPSDDDNDDEPATKPISEPAGTILLEPIRPPTPPLEEIKVEPIQPTYVEMKKPLKLPDGEEEKMMEDPNLMWMHMGPAQYGPPFGSIKRRKAREEEWVGPPCELCHKQIEERRCMLAENMKFHCWHFACSFCMKTLKPADFLIAESDKKPYCLNCHKREFPEISLVNLHLDEGQ